MFTIFALGTLKETYWRDGAAEYIKRLSPFAPVKIVEIKEIGFNKKDRETVVKKEAEKLLPLIKSSAYVILLTPKEKTPDTKMFAKSFEEWRHKSEVVFIIGGPLGTHSSLHTRANETLSLSPLTFTHQMTRVILLEQIYRVVMSEKGKYDY